MHALHDQSISHYHCTLRQYTLCVSFRLMGHQHSNIMQFGQLGYFPHLKYILGRLDDNSIIRFPSGVTLKWEPGQCYDQKKSKIPLILRLAKSFLHLAWFLTDHLSSTRKGIGLKAITLKPPHFTRCYPIKLLFQYSNQLTNSLLCPLPQKQLNTEEFPVLSFEARNLCEPFSTA